MQQLMDRAFARYGMDAVLKTVKGTQKIKVFFESVNSKSLQNMRSCYHALGQLPQGQYICRFPRSVAVQAGDDLQVGSKWYQVCRVEDMLGAQGCVFRWALCTGKRM